VLNTLAFKANYRGRSEEFTKGTKPGGLGTEFPSGEQWHGNPREHQRGRDKKLTYGDGDMHPFAALATPLPTTSDWLNVDL